MNEGFCWNHFSCRFFILVYFIGLEISHQCEVGEFCVMLGTCRCVSFLLVCVTTGVLVQNLVLGFLILSCILRPSPLWGAATLPWPICLCSIGMLPAGEPLILIQVLNEIMICFISEALFWPYPCFLGVYSFCSKSNLVVIVGLHYLYFSPSSFLIVPHVCVHAKSLQSCLTLCNLMDCSRPGSSVFGTSQARILEWVAISFSRGSSWPRDWTHVSWIAGGYFTPEPPGKPVSICISSLYMCVCA